MSTTTVLFPWRGQRAPEVELHTDHTIPAADLERATWRPGHVMSYTNKAGAIFAGVALLVGVLSRFVPIPGPEIVAMIPGLVCAGLGMAVLLGGGLWDCVVQPLRNRAFARRFERNYAGQYDVIGTSGQRDARRFQALIAAKDAGLISPTEVVSLGSQVLGR